MWRSEVKQGPFITGAIQQTLVQRSLSADSPDISVRTDGWCHLSASKYIHRVGVWSVMGEGLTVADRLCPEPSQ